MVPIGNAKAVQCSTEVLPRMVEGTNAYVGVVCYNSDWEMIHTVQCLVKARVKVHSCDREKKSITGPVQGYEPQWKVFAESVSKATHERSLSFGIEFSALFSYFRFRVSF